MPHTLYRGGLSCDQQRRFLYGRDGEFTEEVEGQSQHSDRAVEPAVQLFHSALQLDRLGHMDDSPCPTRRIVLV